MLDRDGLIAHADAAATRIVGQERSALLGRPLESFVAPGSRDACRSAWAEFLRDPALGPTRRWKHFQVGRGEHEVAVRLAFAATGDPGIVLAICTDGMSETHPAVSQADQQHFLAAAGLLAADVFQVVKVSEDRLMFHGDIDGLLGYPPGGFPRTLSGWVDHIHPEDRDRILADWDRDTEEALAEWSYRYRLRAGDGTYRHVWDRGRITGYHDGKADEGFGAVTDETAEMARQESLERLTDMGSDVFGAVLENSRDLIAVRDEEFRLVFFNEGFGRAFRELFDREVTVGMDTTDFLPERELGYWNAVRLLLRRGQPFRGERSYDLGNGDVRHYEIVCTPLFKDGRVIGSTEVNRDVTATRKASLESRRLQEEARYLRGQIEGVYEVDEIVGQSLAIRTTLRRLQQVAATETSVLLLGETGSGKELLARAIHARSPRAAQALIKVDCSNLPPGLIESELFGHEKGAFTGAVESRAGRFELADGGTILLDEIGELPLELQAKLLRVLEEGTFQRLGSKEERRTDVRVIAATNRDLKAEVAKGQFRADLYYRLAVFPIESPPLRERRDDVPLLVDLFVSRYATAMRKTITSVDESSMEALVAYDWPGNIRELKNIIERSVILCTGATLHVQETLGPTAPATGPSSPPSGPLKSDLHSIERSRIVKALEECGWRVKGPGYAADRLGLSPSTLRSRMKRLGIERPKPS